MIRTALVLALVAACSSPADGVDDRPIEATIETGSVRLMMRWVDTGEYFEVTAPATGGRIVATVRADGMRVDALRLDVAAAGALTDIAVRLGTQLEVGNEFGPAGRGVADLVIDWTYQTIDGPVQLATRRLPQSELLAALNDADELSMSANVRSIVDMAQEELVLVQLQFSAGGTVN